jgi:exonuclease SbcD
MSWAAYLAFGHIHKAQTINGAPNARYSGSIQALDLGEKADEKGVVLVDIEPHTPASPQWVPLKSVAPIKAITVHGEADLGRLEPDADTLISATVECVTGQDNYAKIKRELRKLYPRIYSITEKKLTEAGELPPPTRDLNNVNDNIREFLRHAPVKANREELLKLVEEILL